MAYCETNNGNTAELCRNPKGTNLTILFSDSATRPEIADVATAKLEATYDALIKAAKGSRLYPITFTDYEAGEDEQIYDERQRERVLLRTKAGQDMYKLINPEDWDKYNLLLTGTTKEQKMYALVVTDKNFIRGLYDSTRTKVQFNYIKVSITREKNTIDTSESLVFTIESMEPDEWANEVNVEASFDVTELKGLLDLDIQFVSASTTVITVNVFDKATGTVPITDLVTADFIVSDAGGTPLVVTAAHVSGGSYTLTGTFSTGTTCTTTLETPATMDKLYENYAVLDCPIP